MVSTSCQRACTFALDLIPDTIVIILSIADNRLQIEHVNIALEDMIGVPRSNVQNVLSIIEDTDQFVECAMKCLDNRQILKPSKEIRLRKSPSYRSRFDTCGIEDKSSVSTVGEFHPYVDRGSVYCVVTLKINSQVASATSNCGLEVGIEDKMQESCQHLAADVAVHKQQEQKSENVLGALDTETTNKFLREFVESAPFLLTIVRTVDLDVAGGGIIRYVNKPEVYSNLMGCPKDKIVGYRPCECRVPSHEVLNFHKHFKISKDTKLPVMFECVTQRDRNEFHNCVVKYLGDDHYLSMALNETSKKLSQDCVQRHKDELEKTVNEKTKELQEALEIKSRFLAVVSHEIRTPLTGILGMLTLLTESDLKPSQLDAVSIATACCDQLMVVITDILDVSKAEYGNMSFDMKSFSVMTVVEESIDIATIESEKKSLELFYEVKPNMPEYFISDQSRLRQVLVNLLNNAVKFSSKGEILLTVAGKPLLEENWELLFSVADTGIGIPEEAKRTLFKPFQQADTSFTRRYGGSGLGLLICKRIVEQMGGRIWFESQEGKGSTFYFSIVVTASQDKKKPNITNRLKVLLLDPNPTQARILKSYLCSLEMTVTSLPLCSNDLKNDIDLVILDETMTEEMQHYKQLPSTIIVVGRHCSSEKYFVKKPIRYSKLYDCLVSICGQQPSVRNKGKTEGKKMCLNPSLHILLAEDNSMNRRVIFKVLQSCGFYNINTVSNGKEALEMVRKQRFDVILMDCMMPVMDGYSSTKWIRSEVPSADQPIIIALTANVSEENNRLCFSAGMNFVLTKPIQKEVLIETLNKTCPLKASE